MTGLSAVDLCELESRWCSLTALLQVAPAQRALWWGRLQRHYSEPTRSYHGLAHIAALLRLAEAYRPQVRESAVLGLAIWFHDVIYDTRSSDNERRSAELAREALHQMTIQPAICDAVTQCILATERHQPPPSCPPDLPLFLDLDLSILGAPEDGYRRYSHAIRAEYGWVPEADYRRGRSEVLRRFAARERLYFTGSMSDRYELAARRNIARELQELSSSSTRQT